MTAQARALPHDGSRDGRVFPSPTGFAAWIAVTVVAPLVSYDATHRWEEDQSVLTALWWTLAAVPVLAAAAAARWTDRTGRHRAVRAFGAATAVGALISALFLAGSMAFYHWVIPLNGAADWSAVWWAGLLLAVAGAAIGYPIGLKLRRRSARSARWGYVVGAIVAVVGALTAPGIVRLGAEDSTSRYDEGRYGGIGPNAAPAGRSGVLELPAAGRYAILAMGFSPKDPDCLVSRPGLTPRRAEAVSIPPSDYGYGDFATYAWVASFAVPEPGTYSLTCPTSEQDVSYTVGAIPQIRGVVGALIHWPLVLIMLLGSIPGLLIIASTVRRSIRPARAPAGYRQ
jgi:hypothetical protein